MNRIIAEHAVRVLIVDDDADIRNALGMLLRADGFVIENAGNGDEAIRAVSHQRPDIILLDAMMPGRIDGYQTAAQFKSNAATKEIPIIMLSGMDEHDARPLARNAGADDVLGKPVDWRELCARMKKLVSPKVDV